VVDGAVEAVNLAVGTERTYELLHGLQEAWKVASPSTFAHQSVMPAVQEHLGEEARGHCDRGKDNQCHPHEG
jgi:hypothetical protein